MARTARPSRSSAPELEQLQGIVRKLLEHTAEVLIEMGCPPNELSTEFSRICQKKRQGSIRLTSLLAPLVGGLSDLLTRWHADPRFLDRNGEPRALSLMGRGVSLAALMDDALPGYDRRIILRTLIRTKSVRRRGSRYIASRRFFSTAEISHLAYVQSLSSMCGLLQTVRHNVSCADPAQRLLEKRASNSSIPLRYVQDVRRFLKAESNALLERADAYMGQFPASDSEEPTTTIHLVTFVHEELAPKASSTAAVSGARPRRRRRR